MRFAGLMGWRLIVIDNIMTLEKYAVYEIT